MLRAIAIYEKPDGQTDTKPKRIKYAQQDKSTQLFSSNQLANFEENTLPKLYGTLVNNAPTRAIGEENYSNGEYHYVSKTPQDNFFMVICSRNRLMPIEVGYLFVNIRHAHTRSETIKFTLDDMIMNPIGYTGQDKQIDTILEETEHTKRIIMEALNKAIENNHKLEELIAKTDDLERNSVSFNRHAKRLNRCCF